MEIHEAINLISNMRICYHKGFIYFSILLLLSCSKNNEEIWSNIDRSPRLFFYPNDSVYDISQRKWQGIPSIEKSNDNTLWAAWYSGGEGEGADNYVVLCKSEDDGGIWSKPILVIDPDYPTRAFDPCLWVDTKGVLWLFWAQEEEYLSRATKLWAIKQVFDTIRNEYYWSDPQKICDGVMLNKPTVINDGTWLLPVARWADPYPNNPNFKDDIQNTGSFVYASNDFGKTFYQIGSSKVQLRTCDEHMIIERNNSTLWMLVRTIYGIGETFSYDQGRTWEKGQASSLKNADSRFHIRRLKSGNLLLVHHLPPDYQYRDVIIRNFLTASLSLDDGKSWPYSLLIDSDNDVSYPDAIEDKEGNIYIIYDHSRFSKKEIMYAKIKESDIANGSVSSLSRLKQVISKSLN